MAALVAKYGVDAIIVFCIMLAIAIKEFIELVKYFKKVIKEQVHKSEKNDEQDALLANNSEQIKEILITVKDVQKKVGILETSDKDGIKAWIVDQYEKVTDDNSKLTEMGWDLLQRRFKHYKDEGGNSYIESLMDEMKEIHANNR